MNEKPGTSFLISLNNVKTYDIKRGLTATNDTSDCLCFIKNDTKTKNGTKWVINTPQDKFLMKKCTMGEVQSHFELDDVHELVGRNLEYELKDVEIFHVAIEIEDEFGNFNGKASTNTNVDESSSNRNIQPPSQKYSDDENKNIPNFNEDKKPNDNKEDNSFYMAGAIEGQK